MNFRAIFQFEILLTVTLNAVPHMLPLLIPLFFPVKDCIDTRLTTVFLLV